VKTTIFYFSATGNSLSAARDMAGRLGETELVSIPSYLQNPQNVDSPRIGLVFPVHIFGLPGIVSRFIAAMQVNADAYFFAVATCGGMACSTLKDASRLFALRGLTLGCGYALTMVNNCTTVAQAPAPKMQMKKIEKAGRQIEQICRAVEGRKKYVYPGIPVLNWIFGKYLYKKALPKIPSMDRQYSADSNCDSCGICAKVCPARNITMDGATPSWHHRCEACYACLQWCPKESIQMGKKTIGRRRYRHPRVRFTDIARYGAPIQNPDVPISGL
jgi:Fe-S-cluster-containing hydrogenase component 2